jgi:hypothetical protein
MDNLNSFYKGLLSFLAAWFNDFKKHAFRVHVENQPKIEFPKFPRFYESTMTTYSVLDFDSTTETRTYAFPDASGTVALEERALAYSIVL